jgi:hypothetical protein
MPQQKTLGQCEGDSALAFRFSSLLAEDVVNSVDEGTGIVVPGFLSPMPKHTAIRRCIAYLAIPYVYALNMDQHRDMS